MKHVWMNILAFVTFIAVEFVVIHFMGAFTAGSAIATIMGLDALLAGGLYCLVLFQDINKMKT